MLFMIPLLRPLITMTLVLTPYVTSKGNEFVRQYTIQQLQETRGCFGCDLSRVNFSGANLEGVDLRSINLQGANLKNANLRGANLEWADLHNANLEGADLSGANLRETSLVDANLQGANLEASKLETADLRNANLIRANLVKALTPDDIQASNSVTLCQTRLPNGIISGRDCK